MADSPRVSTHTTSTVILPEERNKEDIFPDDSENKFTADPYLVRFDAGDSANPQVVSSPTMLINP